MKRAFATILAVGLLAACGGVTAPGAARSETPQQSLSTTGQRMTQLQSLKFDLTGTVTLTLPQQLVDQLRTKTGSNGGFLSQSMTVALKITGAAQKPNRLDANIEAKLGNITIDTAVIAAGGILYYKDPMTLKWETLRDHAASFDSKANPKLSYKTIIDTAKSVTEVTDSSSALRGTEHYRVVPDLLSLFAQATAGHTENPQLLTAIQAVLQNTNLVFDVWTGTNDHLIHRLSYDADVTVDLNQLAGAFATMNTGPETLTIPAGSIAHLTAHLVINLHDFNSTVKIQPPTVSS